MNRSPQSTLVSIGLPVHNGADTLTPVIRSVLAQTYPDIQLVISDNASTDGTEEIGRHFAGSDDRVVYQRHPSKVCLLDNFTSAAQKARGTYFRWIGDDDSLEPNYVSRALEVFEEDERRVLVTTQIAYIEADGDEILVTDYDPSRLSSPDPVERFAEMMRLLSSDFAVLDPLYGMIRRELILMPRRNYVREDETFAARLALAGPWGHVPEPLARRHRSGRTGVALPQWLGVPAWQWHVRAVRQCKELSYWVGQSSLDSTQRRRARGQILRMYARRKQHRLQRGFVKLGGVVGWSSQPALERAR